MSDDASTSNQDDNSKSDNSDSKINNQNASNRMVRDFISSNYCILVLGPKEFPIALKKIGTYIGKIKNTLSNFQKEVGTATRDIEIDKPETSNKENKKEIDKNG